MYLSKDDLTARLQRAEMDFAAEELGGTVRLRELSVQQRGDISRSATTIQDDGTKLVNMDIWYAGLVREGVVDPETHRPLYSAAEVDVLLHANPKLLALIAQAIYDLSEVGPAHLKSGDSTPDAG